MFLNDNFILSRSFGSISFIIVIHVRKCVHQIIGLCQAIRGHFSRKSSYWSKNFIMVLNVKTMTWYFEKNSVKTWKQHHIVCRWKNPHFSLKSCARKFLYFTLYKNPVLSQRIKNQILPVLNNVLDVLHSK